MPALGFPYLPGLTFIGRIATGLAPQTPYLDLEDNGDGTGAVATIRSGNTLATNLVYVQKIDGPSGNSPWVLAGNRAGNGTVALALSVGHYLVYVKSSSGGGQALISNAVYFIATDAGESVYYRCLLATQSRLRILNLPNVPGAQASVIPPERILVKKTPLDVYFRQPNAGIDYPGILVTPQRDIMNAAAGGLGRDDVIYGVLVTILDRDNQEATGEANLPTYTLWRERIAKAFRSQRLPGVREVFTCAVEPSDVVLPIGWANNLYASALLLKFTARERRGI